MRIRLTVPLAVAFTLVAATSACSSDNTGVAATSSTDSRWTHVLSETPTRTTEVPDIAGKVVVRGVDSACKSPTVADAAVDLLGVHVHLGVPGHSGQAARVTWKLSASLPTTGSSLVTLLATSEDGAVTRQLGYKTVDGEFSAYYVYDMNAAQQRALGGLPDTLTPGRISAVLPAADIDELGDNWHWSAALTLDGKDVDTCPA
ncbi:hypothetical protein HH308_27690 [Gordonia sp. TBRC 11910]|uniref:Lipoprotein n=1 Tax=Gordonia asplenii TaxID=2725283 RepID=A0A848L2P9_9ACTN|nr:hypothetical protein [Gordonia asplenii]NMO05009.1 hypothetical protein [Gordonia asplenii]